MERSPDGANGSARKRRPMAKSGKAREAGPGFRKRSIRATGTWIQISNSAVCRYSFAISRLFSPEVCWNFPHAPRSEGAGMPGADAPAAKNTRVVRHGHTGNTRHPRAMVYGLLRALPGDRALLPPSPLRSLLLKSLTPASRCQDHTTWPSVTASPVSRAATSTASRPDVHDVRETPLWWGGMRWR